LTEYSPAPNNSEPNAPLSTLWRIVIGAVALIIVIIFGWQVWGNQSPAGETDSTTAAVAPTTTVSAADSNAAIGTAESPQSLFEQGNSYYKAGQIDKAIAAFQKTIAKDPSFVAAYSNLGATYYAQKNLPLAEDMYKKAVGLSPNDSDLIYNLSAIYIQEALASNEPDTKKLSLAAEQIDKAIALNPALATPYYGRGVVKSYLGDAEGAIKAFEKFLELDNGSDPKATNNATRLLTQLKTNIKQ